jgi:hypothetical protein
LAALRGRGLTAECARTLTIRPALPAAGYRVPGKRKNGKMAPGRRHWSQRVNDSSDALDLQAGIFSCTDPVEIALSLKKSADSSRRRKAEPFRSAMSMLTFYINRAGRQLPDGQRAVLEQAKDELRALYGRPRRKSDTT